MIRTPSVKARLGLIASIAACAAIASSSLAIAGQPKFTICHAAGRAAPDGPTQYVEITIAAPALYGRHGNAGHFEENGTPRAGHEEDFFLNGGTCENPGGGIVEG